MKTFLKPHSAASSWFDWLSILDTRDDIDELKASFIPFPTGSKWTQLDPAWWVLEGHSQKQGHQAPHLHLRSSRPRHNVSLQGIVQESSTIVQPGDRPITACSCQKTQSPWLFLLARDKFDRMTKAILVLHIHHPRLQFHWDQDVSSWMSAPFDWYGCHLQSRHASNAVSALK